MLSQMVVINFIKKLLGILSLEESVSILREQVATQKVLIEQMYGSTTVDADVNYRGNNTVIISGTLKGIPYVNVYTVDSSIFSSLINNLRPFKSYLRHIDAPPDIRGRIKWI